MALARLLLLLPVFLLGCGGDNGPSSPAPVWSFAAGEDTTLAAAGSDPDLSGFITARCVQGIAIGYTGNAGDLIDQLRLRCAAFNPDGSLGLVVPSPALGSSSGGTPESASCPEIGGDPSVLVGDAGYANGHIHQTNGRCRRLADVLLALANDTAATRTGAFGGGPHPDSEGYGVACPAGSVVIGFRGRQELGTGYPIEIAYLCRALTYQ